MAIHFIASHSLRTAIHRKKRLPKDGDYDEKLTRRGVLSKLVNEITLSSNSGWKVSDLFNVRLGPVAVTLQYIGAFLAVVHLLFGTMVF